MKVRSQLRLLVAAKEHREGGKRYSLRNIVEATKPYTSDGKGISIAAVQSLMNDDWQRLERETLDALCTWLECEPGDLLKREAA